MSCVIGCHWVNLGTSSSLRVYIAAVGVKCDREQELCVHAALQSPTSCSTSYWCSTCFPLVSRYTWPCKYPLQLVYEFTSSTFEWRTLIKSRLCRYIFKRVVYAMTNLWAKVLSSVFFYWFLSPWIEPVHNHCIHTAYMHDMASYNYIALSCVAAHELVLEVFQALTSNTQIVKESIQKGWACILHTHKHTHYLIDTVFNWCVLYSMCLVTEWLVRIIGMHIIFHILLIYVHVYTFQRSIRK